MPLLILLRHGQSQWNLENRFTGTVDIPLSKNGEAEAWKAGCLLKAVPIDKIYTSALRRAIDTASIVVMARCGKPVPRVASCAFNERSYGNLEGLNKAEVESKYGAAVVKIWRRSYDQRPPHGESLKDTAERTLPYFEQNVLRDIRDGMNVLLIAHGNSLRAIVMSLDGLTAEEITELNIPTGKPLIYKMTVEGKPIGTAHYLEPENETAPSSTLLPTAR